MAESSGGDVEVAEASNRKTGGFSRSLLKIAQSRWKKARTVLRGIVK